MYISEFQLNNYKSYRTSEPLKLLPGINVVIGQNHTGKTALLEGLSLQFSSNPFRSSKIRIRPGTNDASWAVVSFTLGHDELFELLGD